MGTSSSAGMRPDSGYAGSNVGTGSTNAGLHNSKVDPRVDSDIDVRNGFDTSGAGTGGDAGNQTRGNGITTTETKPSMVEKIKRAL